MRVGSAARVIAVLAACAAAAGSATSTSNSSATAAASGPQSSPPPPQQMSGDRALGLWRSTFGAVKIEADSSRGGLDAGALQGIWVYQRQGREVIGYFSGSLRGNVLQFHWQEPGAEGQVEAPLAGEGFLVFDVQGRQYSGRWWSDRRDRVGDWNGWRQPGAQVAEPQADSGAPDSGAPDSGADNRGDDDRAAPPPPPSRGYRRYQQAPAPQPQHAPQTPPPPQYY